VVNVQTGEVASAAGLRGELRDGIVVGDTALCLTTHALCNLRVLPKPQVVACHQPAGCGTYLWRLLDFGDEMVAATGWCTKSVLVMRRGDGSVVKRLHMASPQASVRLGDSKVRLLSFHGEEAADYELPSLRRVARRPLPLGTTPVVADEEIYVLTGSRVSADSHIPIEKLWDVLPKHIVAIDRADLTVKRTAPVAFGARSVAGILDDTLIVSTDSGLRLVRRSDLVTLGSCEVAQSVWECTFVPGARAAVVQSNRFVPTELTVVRWRAYRTVGSPDNLLAPV
jgi:hypothetical protein